MLVSGHLIASPALVRAPLSDGPPAPMLTLWADDAHDDAAALSMLLSGGPVRAAATGQVLRAPQEGGWVILRGGTYLVDGLVRPGAPFMLLCAQVRQAPYRPETGGIIFDLSGMPPLRPGEATNAIFRHCRLQAATDDSAADVLDLSP